MPDIIPMLVVFGFLAAALLLRVIAGAQPTRLRVRAGRTGFSTPHAMMDE
ncbi:hypothetical protein OHB26_01080 [Nocardia sp. NBC_01503]|nr:hypothetical protein [Nocardia sp. NBC_01503]WTL32885.1 hypothetical protein OHB26_01080 [Nocardia sp. NBC_01503]